LSNHKVDGGRRVPHEGSRKISKRKYQAGIFIYLSSSTPDLDSTPDRFMQTSNSNTIVVYYVVAKLNPIL
jgi:hypothetical protein